MKLSCYYVVVSKKGKFFPTTLAKEFDYCGGNFLNKKKNKKAGKTLILYKKNNIKILKQILN
jgi:hypothetical protein